MLDARGALVPIDVVKPQDLMLDELVRRLFAAAAEVSAALSKFKAETFGEIDAFAALLADRYGAQAGGDKGNVTLQTFDGCLKVQVQVSDQHRFGPELQAAKALVDECLNDWAEGSRAELRAIVTQAFDVDREGQINRGRLFALLRYDIKDARWMKAMEALRDSIRVDGSKRYLRFYSRTTPKDAWRPLSLDAATA